MIKVLDKDMMGKVLSEDLSCTWTCYVFQVSERSGNLVLVDECLLDITSHGPIHLIPLIRNGNVSSKGKLLK